MLILPWNGNSNAAIARQMRVNVSTVDTQIERVFKALGVHSRMQLAQRVDAEVAAMRGWIKQQAANSPSKR